MMTRASVLNDLALWDKIHPDYYKIKPKDHHIYYDLAAIAEYKAQQAEIAKQTVASNSDQSPMLPIYNRLQLKAKIQEGHAKIRAHSASISATITPRIQAHNRKCTYKTIEEEQASRANLVSAQINNWRSFLPTLARQFSKIKDPRRVKSVEHKLVLLMLYGLFAFIFQMNSRREMNRELTSATIMTHLNRLFPEFDSIPHADTLARILKRINPKEIESAHIELIRSMIHQKKFKRLLINGCLPISIDGTQKLYRDGLLNDSCWCERTMGQEDNKTDQQYIYAIEANITLHNGLNIPLMTEYLYRYNNRIEQPKTKQDNEITAFERMSKRLKHYFPKLKILLCMDAMYATAGIFGIIHQNNWHHMIVLPKRKLTRLAKLLKEESDIKTTVPRQTYYRERQQEFYWRNYVRYNYDNHIHLVACVETYYDVNKQTGEMERHESEHAWISSMAININNAHELCNLGARKKELIEDSFNTEKNRGYNYKHAFAYDWHTMQGFHYLMRLAHAINALSEFTEILKQYVKNHGCLATLKFIKSTLFSPWLPVKWYEEQRLKTPQLCLQLE